MHQNKENLYFPENYKIQKQNASSTNENILAHFETT